MYFEGICNIPNMVIFYYQLQIWDLAKCCAGVDGGLKLTLTGHINAVRGLAISDRHPYLFSGGEDKMVKCKLSVLYDYVSGS